MPLKLRDLVKILASFVLFFSSHLNTTILYYMPDVGAYLALTTKQILAYGLRNSMMS